MNTIPLLNLQAQIEGLEPGLSEAFAATLLRCDFILGHAVREFEEAFAAYLGVKHVVSCANGTDALLLALKAAGVTEGDRIITSALTFPATAEAILHAGALPVLLEVSGDTETLDPDRLRSFLASIPRGEVRPKGIVPVHLRGNPCAMERIMAIAEEFGLFVIEDAAQSHGATTVGRKTGTFGAAGAFSFYPGKNLGALGDAGAIATNDDRTAESLRRLGNHGRLSKFDHETLGYNSRLDTIQAAWLKVKLPHLDRWNDARRSKAAIYDERLKSLPGLRTPMSSRGGHHVYHHYAVRVAGRDRLAEELSRRRIASGIHYPDPVHLIPAFRGRSIVPTPLTLTEEICRSTLSLPIYPELTKEDIDRVASAVSDHCRSIA